MSGGRHRGVSLAPNVSLLRQPFITLQQQLKLEQRDAASVTNDKRLNILTTNDRSTDDLSDSDSVSSDRCELASIAGLLWHFRRIYVILSSRNRVVRGSNLFDPTQPNPTQPIAE